MARIDFITQLQALGYDPIELAHNVIAISYTVNVGKNRGLKAQLGIPVGRDFPMNCPAGIHFLKQDEGWQEPQRNITNSPLGGGWRYWSRRFPDWNRTDRSVRTFFSHIRNILTQV